MTTIFIAGGTGFIGSNLLVALKDKGYEIRCLARTSGRAALCKQEGFEPVTGDITDRESLRGALEGVDMVVHLVGIIEDKGEMTFERVHVEGTGNLVEEAKLAGIKHFFYQSALGASLNSSSRYQKTKAEAEEIVKNSGIPYTIFRPSLVIGDRDSFTWKLKELIGLGPVVIVPGDGKAKFQPIYVEDWVKCFLKILSDANHTSRIYEFGGPEHLTYNELTSQLMEAMGIKKSIVHMPMFLAKAGVPFMGLSQRLGKAVGRTVPSVTHEQLNLMARDNICDIDSIEKNFGFKPLKYKEALKKFIIAASD